MPVRALLLFARSLSRSSTTSFVNDQIIPHGNQRNPTGKAAAVDAVLQGTTGRLDADHAIFFMWITADESASPGSASGGQAPRQHLTLAVTTRRRPRCPARRVRRPFAVAYLALRTFLIGGVGNVVIADMVALPACSFLPHCAPTDAGPTYFTPEMKTRDRPEDRGSKPVLIDPVAMPRDGQAAHARQLAAPQLLLLPNAWDAVSAGCSPVWRRWRARHHERGDCCTHLVQLLRPASQ